MFNKKSLLLIAVLFIHTSCTLLMAAASTPQTAHPFLPNSIKYLTKYAWNSNHLDMAITSDDVDCIKKIAADPSCKEELEKELHKTDKRGETHLFYAARRHSDKEYYSPNAQQMCELLIELGVDPKTTNINGHIATQAAWYVSRRLG